MSSRYPWSCRPIPRRDQPKKVWKHFYDDVEAWDCICEANVDALRATAERQLRVQRNSQPDLPWIDPGEWPAARLLLCGHHDDAYGPTYLAELERRETNWAPHPDDERREIAVTPRSIFASLYRGRPREVVTAFRPHPELQTVRWGEDEQRRHALHYFGERVYMSSDQHMRHLVQRLSRVGETTPATVKDLWWLASAVGYARPFKGEKGVDQALARAEEILAGTAEELVAEFVGLLDWNACTESLATGLLCEDLDDVEAALASSEELVAAASAVGAGRASDAFMEELEELIAWVPSEWTSIGRMARRRLGTFSSGDEPISRMWSAVEAAHTAALIRDVQPTLQPEATLVDSLLPEEPSLLERVEQLARRSSAEATKAPAEITTWLSGLLAHLRVESPQLAPAMSGTSRAVEHMDVHLAGDTNGLHVRVFIIDDDSPNGAEVTARFKKDGGLWRYAIDEAPPLVVFVASHSDLPGQSLDDVLANSADCEGIVVQTRVAHPTQATKESS